MVRGFRPPDGKKWWAAPETRESAIDDARYYMLCDCPKTAFSIIVALCASLDKKGTDAYDENLENTYRTAYQRTKQ